MRKRFFTDKWLPFWIFLAAVIVETLFLLILPVSFRHIQSTDYLNFYAPTAEHFRTGSGFTNHLGQIEIRYPPGFPFLLSLIFQCAVWTGLDRFIWILFFNILCGAVSAIFVFQMGQILFNRRIALVAILLWLTYPFHLWLLKQPNSEVPFIPLFFAGLYVFILALKHLKFSFFFLSGVLMGLAALIRPANILGGLLLGIVILGFQSFPWKKRITYSILPIIGFLLAVLPWEIHVYLSMGKLIPLSSGSFPSIMDGMTFATHTGVGGHQTEVPKDVLLLMNNILNSPEQITSWGQLGSYLVGELQERPMAVLQLLGIKFLRAWYATDEMWYENYTLLIQCFYLFPAVIGFIITARRFRDSLPLITIFMLFVAYYWALTTVMLSILRYMVPVMGLMLILAAVTGEWGIEKIRELTKNRILNDAANG